MTRTEPARRSLTPRRFLVAVDHSAEAEAALDIAAHLAHGVGATVTLLAVAPLAVGLFAEPQSTIVRPALDQDELDRPVRELLDDLTARVRNMVDVRTKLAREPAGHAIVEEAAQGGHDLIVMPSRGSGGLGHLLHDHTARHVLNHVRLPVLAVPALTESS
jgi:nucleotide-binding universal stress UspA family protein